MFVIRRLMRETCISIKGSNQIGEYSYGQIRCIEDKSVNVQQIWFDNEGNCEYETSKRKEIFNERLSITCESFSLCKVSFYRSNVNRNYTYLNLRFHCAECIPIYHRTKVRITCPANNSIVIDDIWDDSGNCPAYRYPPQKMTNTKKTLYNLCNESQSCSMIYSSPIDMVTSIFYHCKENDRSATTPVYVSTQILLKFNRSLFSSQTTEARLGRSYVTISSTMSDERSAEENVCMKITAGGAVSFSAIIIFLLAIIYIQRRKLIKASFTSLTARRDQNYYNEISHQMTDSTEEHGYVMSSLPSASGCQATVQQNMDKIQHIGTSGYLIPSDMSQMSGAHYESIDN